MTKVTPINFWLLCSAGMPPPSADLQLCSDVIDAYHAGDTTAAIDKLASSSRPIAVELDAPAEQRRFHLPGNTVLKLRERSFGEASYGHRVWEAGIAMAIWLSGPNADLLRGRSVLELGAGVAGIGSLAGVLAADGCSRLTLTDSGSSETLLSTLTANAAANGVDAATASLDWHACLEPAQPSSALGTFDVVLASDCIYHRADAEPLAAAVLAHTAAGGRAVLMNRTGRQEAADALLLELLEAAARATGGHVAVEELAIVDNFSSEALQLITYTKPLDATLCQQHQQHTRADVASRPGEPRLP